MAETAGNLWSGISNNPDQAMRLGAQVAPMVGAPGLRGPLAGMAGATELGMYNGRLKTARDQAIAADLAKSEGRTPEPVAKLPRDPFATTEATLKDLNDAQTTKKHPVLPTQQTASAPQIHRNQGTPAAGKLTGGAGGVVSVAPPGTGSGTGPGNESQSLEALAKMLIARSSGGYG